MTRLYLVLATLGILSLWGYRELLQAEKRGALKAQLASTDSMRVRLTQRITADAILKHADSVLIASLTHQKAVAVTEAARRGEVAANRLLGANQAILALRDSASDATNARLDTIQSALDSTMAYAVSERAARVLADSLTGILRQRLAKAEGLLFASDSLVQRQAVLLAALKPKTPSPISLGCAVGPTVSAAGFQPLGIACGLVVRLAR